MAAPVHLCWVWGHTCDTYVQCTSRRANFYGTKQLLDLAAEMPHLRSFVYLSTYYVNCFMPYNTPVPEEVHYPTLQLAGTAICLICTVCAPCVTGCVHSDHEHVLRSIPSEYLEVTLRHSFKHFKHTRVGVSIAKVFVEQAGCMPD